MKKLKSIFTKVKSSRLFSVAAIALAGVMLVSLLTLVPSVTSVDADSQDVASENETTEVMGIDEAVNIAVTDANVTNATFNEIKLDTEDGVQIYAMEFVCDNIKYEYKINALTGKIISCEKDKDDTPTSNTISQDEAKKIVMNHAGVSNMENYEIEADTDDNIDIYKIEFTSGNYKYEYKINATNGTVIKFEKSAINKTSTSSSNSSNSSSSSSTSSSSTSSSISESEAKSIAMNHAGVSSVSNCSISTCTKSNCKAYKVVFTSGNYKYKYFIRKSDGKVLDCDKDKTFSDHSDCSSSSCSSSSSSSSSNSSSSSSSSSIISESKAKSIATNHAGVSSVSRYEIKLDYKDNVQVYKIEFESGKYEYEYVIRASDGSILRYEKND